MVGFKKKKSNLPVVAGSLSDKTDLKRDDDFLFDTKNEQLILGQVLNSDVCRTAFVENCEHQDFLIDNHKVIAFCIMQAHGDGVQITDDVFDIYRYDYPSEEKATGGLGYIAKLRKSYNDNLTTKSFKLHIQKLKKDSIKYKIQSQYLQKMVRLVRDPSSSLDELSEVGSEIENLLSESLDFEKKGFKDMTEANIAHDKAVEDRKKSGFGSTGFSFVDSELSEGNAPGLVSVCAGRPGMGKSTYVANSIVRLSNKPSPVPTALFSLEMPTISMVDRLNSIETDIPLKKLIQRDLTADELALEKKIKKKREKKPIFICDDVRKTLAEVKRELKNLKEKEGIKVCFIDLFMKLKKPGANYNKSTADQYTEMLNEIQRIARELWVHICIVVQIGRKAEDRKDKRPMMSDLKDCGGYEEVADLIFLFYREAYYISKNVEDDFEVDVLEINIAKQRQGKVGIVKSRFIGETTKILKLNEDDEETFNKTIASLKKNSDGNGGGKRYDGYNR